MTLAAEEVNRYRTRMDKLVREKTRALEKSPANRYQSAQEMLAASSSSRHRQRTWRSCPWKTWTCPSTTAVPIVDC